MQMKMSEAGRIHLAVREGLTIRIYFDTENVRTLGIGATVTELPNIAKMSLSEYHSIDELITLYFKALVKYETAVNKMITVPLKQYQFDALVSLGYNIGIGKGGLLTSTLVKRINASADAQSIYDAFMMWTKQKYLIPRRKTEANMFRYGKYENDGKMLLRDTDGKGHEVTKGQKMVDVKALFDAYYAKYNLLDTNTVVTVKAPSNEEIELKPATTTSLSEDIINQIKTYQDYIQYVRVAFQLLI